MGANQFWNLRVYSLILAKAGKTSEAIAAAKQSLAKAKEANKQKNKKDGKTKGKETKK